MLSPNERSKLLISMHSLVQSLRFLLRDISLAIHLVIEDAEAGKDYACYRNESWSDVGLSHYLDASVYMLTVP